MPELLLIFAILIAIGFGTVSLISDAIESMHKSLKFVQDLKKENPPKSHQFVITAMAYVVCALHGLTIGFLVLACWYIITGQIQIELQ